MSVLCEPVEIGVCCRIACLSGVSEQGGGGAEQHEGIQRAVPGEFVQVPRAPASSAPERRETAPSRAGRARTSSRTPAACTTPRSAAPASSITAASAERSRTSASRTTTEPPGARHQGAQPLHRRQRRLRQMPAHQHDIQHPALQQPARNRKAKPAKTTGDQPRAAIAHPGGRLGSALSLPALPPMLHRPQRRRGLPHRVALHTASARCGPERATPPSTRSLGRSSQDLPAAAAASVQPDIAQVGPQRVHGIRIQHATQPPEFR